MISITLTRIHKTLMNAEFQEIEKTQGPIGPAGRLQMLLHGAELAWLRHLSQLMSLVDGVIFQKEQISDAQIEEVRQAARSLFIDETVPAFVGKFREAQKQLTELAPEFEKLKLQLKDLESKRLLQ